MPKEAVVIIGAGPCGLSAAVELKKKGIDPLLIEKGTIVNSIYEYPTYMVFHSTPELLEIGGVPFMTPNEKPTRLEALHYYRTVAQRHQLRIRTYEKVLSVHRSEGECFRIETEDRFGNKRLYHADYVVVATGYFDHPNRLDIPGIHLPKVFSFFKEAHPFAGTKTAIVGGNNSAVDAALEIERVGGKVTVICRGETLSDRVKAWVRPVFESMVRKGRIRIFYRARLREVREYSVLIEQEGNVFEMENDFVLQLIGFRPDRTLLKAIGVHVDPDTNVPQFDPKTMQTNVSGLYIAGVIAAGNDANAIFIENGRFHGELIAADLAGKVRSRSS